MEDNFKVQQAETREANKKCQEERTQAAEAAEQRIAAVEQRIAAATGWSSIVSSNPHTLQFLV